MVESHLNDPESDPLLVASTLMRHRQRFALAIVTETFGAATVRVGTKALMSSDGARLAGSIGGRFADAAVAEAAAACLKAHSAQTIDVNLDGEIPGAGLPYRGAMRVYVEAVTPPPTIWILGHGRVAEEICRLGILMGFEVIVDDPMASTRDFPGAKWVVAQEFDYDRLAFGPEDHVVVITVEHGSLKRVLQSDVGSIALIACAKRADAIADSLRDEGLAQRAANRLHVHHPLAGHSQTAEDLARSVVSELARARHADLAIDGGGALEPATHGKPAMLSPIEYSFREKAVTD
jgi:xanthine dehydrogenase accessory factor